MPETNIALQDTLGVSASAIIRGGAARNRALQHVFPAHDGSRAISPLMRGRVHGPDAMLDLLDKPLERQVVAIAAMPKRVDRE